MFHRISIASSWAVVGLVGRAENDELRRTIFHEAVHWLASASPDRPPLWFNEGLAEVFSTFRVEKGKARWGEAVPWHILLLRHERPLPLERLVWIGRDDPLFNENTRTGIFYAQSWAFVHYLMFGQHEGNRSAVADFHRALRSGGHPDEVFREAFGTDYAGMDRQLDLYLRNGRYYMGSRPAPEADLGDAAFEPAAPGFVEAALARLALGGGRGPLAREHAERAVATAPELAEAWTTLATVRVGRGVVHQAREAARAGRLDEAKSLLQPLVDADDTPPMVRRNARRLLETTERAGAARASRRTSRP